RRRGWTEHSPAGPGSIPVVAAVLLDLLRSANRLLQPGLLLLARLRLLLHAGIRKLLLLAELRQLLFVSGLLLLPQLFLLADVPQLLLVSRVPGMAGRLLRSGAVSSFTRGSIWRIWSKSCFN